MKSLISRILMAGLMLMACMAIPAPLSLATTSQNIASSNNSNIDCNLTPNPDQCWQQKSQQTWTPSSLQSIPLTSSAWGLDGPLAGSLKYDAELSWILGLNYLHMFTDRLGLAGKVTFGPNERRANLTSGYKHSDKHQFKLTYEYLNQNIPFDFQAGTFNQWLSQHAVGGAYQYQIRQGILHSLELSGSFARATDSKNLPSLIYYEGDMAFANVRRIAAGEETIGLATINLLPFSTTALALGAGYSQVNYDTWWQNDQNNSGIAYKVELNHVFHPTLKASASVNNTASSTEYAAKVSKILPKNFELSLGGLHQAGRANLPDANSLVLGVSYPAPKSYTIDKDYFGSLAELKNWLDRPIVYYNRVLAVKDEKTIKYAINSQPIPSQVKSIGSTIDPVQTKDYFVFEPTLYERVDYAIEVIPAGQTAKNSAKSGLKGGVRGQSNAIDYAQALNLAIVPATKYDAIVQSTGPIPGGQNLEGDYNVTITAQGYQPGLVNPVTEVRTFSLTVLYAGPSWTKKPLPTATINTNYPYPDSQVDLAQDSGTDKGFVQTQDLPNDQYTFKLLKGPSWLQLKDQQYLVANGLVDKKDTAPVTVELQVTSRLLNESSTKRFEIKVEAGAPLWNETLPDGQYGVPYPETDLTKYVKSPGEVTSEYEFKVDQPLPSWLQLNSNGILKGTNNIPESASIDTQIYVTARDTRTGESTPGILTIHLLPGAPIWTDNTLPDAQENVVYQPVDLSPKLHTPGLPGGDTYQMALPQGVNNPTWLEIQNGHFLTSKGPVPSNTSGTVTVTIKATSQNTANKLTATQTFKLVITKAGAPIWKQTDLPDGQYGITYGTVNLHDYVSTPNNDKDQYQFTVDPTTVPSWLKISQDGVVQGTQTIPEGAPKVVVIAITVTSTTSNISTPGQLVINIKPGTPIWIDNTLPDAQRGVLYETVDLSPKVRTPGWPSDTYNMQLTGANNPSWLTISNGHYLTTNGTTVPSDAPDTVAVTVTATSENTAGPNNQATETFNLTVTKPNAPIWTQTDLPHGQYNALYPTVSLQNYVTTPGAKDNYTFKPLQALPSWLQLNSDGTLSGTQNIPDNAPRYLEIQVEVASTVTGIATPGTLLIYCDPGVPVWTDDTLPDAQQQVTYGTVNLATKLHTPGLPGDTYVMSLGRNSPSWLTIENGHDLVGNGPVPLDAPATIVLTITAVSQGTTNKLSSSQTFNLTVTKSGAPIWSGTDLPDGRYGQTYNQVNLNDYVNTPTNGNDHYTFKPAEPLPSWLNLAADGTLTGSGNIPDAAPTVVNLKIVVTSTESGISTPGTLVINLRPGAPVWSGDLPQAQYNATYTNTDLLPMVRTPGEGSDSYNFHLDEGPSWLKINAGDHVLIGASPVPETDASPVTVKISVQSVASQLTTQQTFSVTIKSGIPVWTDNNLPDAQQGVNFSADLLPKLHTPGLIGDTYVMTLDPANSPSWLQIGSDGHSLTSIGAVPIDQTSPVQVTVKAVSQGNSLSAAQTFSLTITEAGSPVWNSTDLPDARYNAVYNDGAPLELTDYVSTPGNINDQYTFSPADNTNLPSWLSLSSNGTLQGVGAIPDNAPATVEVQIQVTSNYTKRSTPGTLVIRIKPGAPIWSGDLPPAQYNTTYASQDLLPYVHTPGSNSDDYQFTLQQKPSWLALGNDGHSLVGVAQVPETDTSPAIVKMTISSSAAQLSTSQTLDLIINPGNPVWDNTTLPNAQEGTTYPTVDLAPKLHTPGLPGDTYTMKLDTNVPWLQIAPDGHSLAGVGTVPNQTTPVTIQITATSQKASGNLQTTQSFTIDILNGLNWSGLNPDATTAGTPNYNYVVDQLVSCPANNQCTVSLSNLPSWLSIQNNPDGTTAIVSNQPVPVAAQDPSGTVSFEVAAATKSGQTLPPKTFNILINNVLPVWTDPATPPRINFDGSSDPHLIHLNSYITAGLTNLAIKPGAGFDPNNWQVVQNGADYYLQRTTTAGTGDIGQSVSVSLVATNSTSQTPQTHSITVNVTANSSLPGADWSGAEPPATTAGTPNYSYVVNQLVTCPSGDQCPVKVINKPVWLDVQVAADGTTTLVSNQAVPPAGQDPSGTVSFDMAASSVKSGKALADKTFEITINNVLPVWTDPATAPSVNFDGSSDPHLIHLNSYITAGLTNLAIKAGAGFNANNWQIVQNGADYYLQRTTTASTDDIGTAVSIPLVATNSTSQTPQTHSITVNVTANSGLPGPDWSGVNPPGATAGASSYSFVVNQLITCPSGDQCTLQVTNVPSWLTITNNADGTVSLVGNQIVPTAPQDPSGTVSFDVAASSLKSGRTLDTQSFNIQVNNVLPIWTDPATAPSVNFDGSSDPHLIHLNSYITAGLTNLAIKPGAGFDANNWQIVQNGADYYLQRTTTASTDDIGQAVSVSLVATNSTSQTPQSHSITVNVTANSSLPGADWSGEQPPAATAGTPTYSYVVNQLVTCPAGDQCPVKVIDKPDWLDVQVAADGTTTLVSNQVVPTAAQDPSGTVSFDMAASSVKSGKLLDDKTFEITVNNVLPVWTDPATAPSVNFDGSSDPHLIHLNTYITQGITNLVIAKGSNFNANNWQIVQQGTDYYLQRTTTASTDDIGTAVSIPLVATNSTSQTPQTHNITVNVTANSGLPGPDWSGINPPGTTAGTANYSFVVNQLITCPSGDQCTLQVTNVPSWLTVTNNTDGTVSLVGNQVVPAAPQDPSGTVSFDVTASSLKSGHTLDKQSFNIDITNVLPVWTDPATAPSVNFDGSSDPHLIHLNTYITQGIANLAIGKGSNFDANNWQIVQEGADYYLQRMTTASTDDIGTAVSIPLVATNSTSQTPQTHSITINVTANSDLPGPGWSGVNPANATAGTNYSFVVNQLVSCPSGDQCPVKVSNVPDWLDVQVAADGTTTLVSNQTVPAAAQDPSGTVSFDVEASSVKSGHTLANQSFNIEVMNVLPVWTDPATAPSVNFDGSSDPHLIHLNTYITQGLTNLAIGKGSNFDANNWQIVQEGTDYYLQRTTTAGTDDIGTAVSIPLVATNSTSQTPQTHSITVNVSANSDLPGPGWSGINPPGTTAGTPNYSFVVNQLITCPTGDQCTLQVTNVPSWLTVTNNADGTVSLVSNQVVPAAAQDPSGTVSFDVAASSLKSGRALDTQSFNIEITNVLPVWTDPATAPSVNFDGSSDPHLIHLNTYITQGLTNLAIGKGSNFDANNWQIVQEGTDYYLQRTTTASTDDIGTAVSIPLVATNSTSQTPQTHSITVNVTANSGLPGPGWSGINPPGTTAGTPSYSFVVNQLITCPTGDQCTLQVTNVPSWLTVTNNADGTVSLVSNQVVPTAAQDPSGTVSFDVAASSVKSGHVLDPQSFNIQIINVLPVWTDPATAPSVNFDGSSDPHLIHLNSYITAGLTNLAIKSGAGFDANNWQIVQEGTDYYLQRTTTASTDDIGTAVSIPLVATNSTSQTPQTHSITVNVTANSGLPGPGWSGVNPPNATAGTSYSFVVNQLISCPSGDQCPVKVSNVPDWLDVQVAADGTTTLVSNQAVPTAAQDPSGTVSFDMTASSVKSGNSLANQSFNIEVMNVLPVWTDPATAPSVNFDGSSDPHLIHLNTYITQGLTNLAIGKGSNFDANNWQIVQEGADYYLQRTTTASTDDIGTAVSIPLVATNSTSQTPQTHSITVNVTANSGLPGPDWSGVNPPATVAGTPSYSFVVNQLITCPTGDQCTLQVTNVPSWLTVTNNADGTVSLVSNQVVPTAPQDPSGTVSFDVAASSLKSGRTLDTQSFNIQVNNVLPIWTDPATAPSVNFDGSSDPQLIHLNSYITAGLTNLAIKEGAGFNANNWQIVQDGTDYYLQRTTTASTDDIGTAVSIPLVATNSTSQTPQTHSITVNVTANSDLPGPGWSGINPPGATAGASSYSFVVNQLITCPSGDQCTLQVTNVPAWLTVTNNADGTVSLVGNQVVPTAPQDPSGTVSFDVAASSVKSGHTLDTQSFNIQITNVLPVWTDPATAPSVNFDGSSDPHLIHLNSYITAGLTNLAIKSGTGFDANNWQIVQDGTDYYLQRTTTASTDDIGTAVSIPLVATNSTSQTPQTHNITVNVTANSGLPGPDWSGVNPPGATAGASSYSFVVNQLITCPSGDQCTLQVTNVPAWLTVTNNADGTVSLVGNQVVPTAPQDPSGTVSFDVAASSLKSGRTLDTQSFNIQITNVLPVWTDPATAPSVNFDGSSDPHLIHLNTYITQGLTNLAIGKGSNFDANNWQIVQEGTDYYLQRTTTASTDDIGTAVSIPLVATNSTSQTPQTHSITVNVTANSDLPGPGWSGIDPPGTIAGTPSYAFVVNQLITCPTGDQCTLQVTNVPSWLTLTNNADGTVSLVSNQVVPAAPQDPSGTVSFDVTASSLKSGHTLGTQSFNIQITNVLPVWTDPATAPSVNFDGSSDPHLIHLNSYITAGLTNLAIKSGAGFDANNWQIVQEGTDYYLQRTTTASTDDIGTAVSIPLVATNSTSQTPQTHSITVNVTANSDLPGPGWSGVNPPATVAGTPNYSFVVNQLITCPSGDQCTLQVTNVPAWLTVTNNADGTVSLVGNQAVPAAAQDPSGTVSFDVAASSVKSGHSLANQSFNIEITNVLPIWADPATAPSVNFDGSSDPHLIHLNTYITAGLTNLVIAKGDNFDANNWQIVQEGADYYLQRTTTASTDDIGTAVSIPLVATNSTSQTPQTHSITVNVTANSSLPGPNWSGVNPPDATAGTPSYTFVVNQLITCPTGDQCTLQVTNVPAWLTITNNADGTVSLVSNQAVPVAAQDPSGTVSFDVAASSLKSGNKLDKQSFNITINNVLPIWQNIQQSTINFDNTTTPIPSGSVANSLNDWIAPNTNNGIAFKIDPSDPGKCATNFNANNWQLAAGSANIYRTTADISDIYDGTNPSSIVNIPVLATNNTSVAGTGTCIPVVVQPSPGNDPVWLSTNLPAVYGGESGRFQYNANLGDYINDNGNKAFSCKIDSQSSSISWMTLSNDSNNNMQQISNSSVPGVNDNPTITLQCQSKNTGRWTAAKTFTLVVPPVFKLTTDSDIPALTSILFDDVTTGINLQSLLVSGRYGAKITVQGHDKNYILTNWVVNGTQLLRKVNNNTIDASEFSNSGGIVAVDLTASNSTSTLQDKTTYPLTVQPDPNLVYRYNDPRASVSVVAVNPPASPGMISDAFTLDPSMVIPYSPGNYKVVNDAGYAYSKVDPAPGFIDYSTINNAIPKLGVQFAALSDLSKTSIAWNIGVTSYANRGAIADTSKNVYQMPMPKLIPDTLALIPPSQGSSGIMNLGNSILQDQAGNYLTYETYLQLNLGKNMKFLVQQVANKASSNVNDVWGLICPNGINQITVPNQCPNNTPSMGYLTPGTIFDTGNLDTITFILAAVNLVSKTPPPYTYPVFLYNPSAPITPSANTVLKLQ